MKASIDSAQPTLSSTNISPSLLLLQVEDMVTDQPPQATATTNSQVNYIYRDLLNTCILVHLIICC